VDKIQAIIHTVDAETTTSRPELEEDDEDEDDSEEAVEEKKEASEAEVEAVLDTESIFMLLIFNAAWICEEKPSKFENRNT
jgi:hypothetical protein